MARTITIRVTRPEGAGDYSVRAEVIEGQHVLAKMTRKLRVDRDEPVTLDGSWMHAMVQGVLDELIRAHSWGVQEPLPF